MRILKRKGDNLDWEQPSSQIAFAHDEMNGIRHDAVLTDVDSDGDRDCGAFELRAQPAQR